MHSVERKCQLFDTILWNILNIPFLVVSAATLGVWHCRTEVLRELEMCWVCDSDHWERGDQSHIQRIPPKTRVGVPGWGSDGAWGQSQGLPVAVKAPSQQQQFRCVLRFHTCREVGFVWQQKEPLISSCCRSGAGRLRHKHPAPLTAGNERKLGGILKMCLIASQG